MQLSDDVLSCRIDGIQHNFNLSSQDSKLTPLKDSDTSKLLVKAIRNRLQTRFEKLGWIRLGSTFIVGREHVISIDISYLNGRISILPVFSTAVFESVQNSTKTGLLDCYLAPTGTKGLVFVNGNTNQMELKVQVDDLQFLYPSHLIFVPISSIEANVDPIDLMFLNDFEYSKKSKMTKQNEEIDEDEDLVIKKRANLLTPSTYYNVFSPQYFANTPMAYSPSPVGEVISPIYSPGGIGLDFRSPPPVSPLSRPGNGPVAGNNIQSPGNNELEDSSEEFQLPTRWQPLELDIACLSDSTYGKGGLNYQPIPANSKLKLCVKKQPLSGPQFVPSITPEYLMLNYEQRNLDYGGIIRSCDSFPMADEPWIMEIKIRALFTRPSVGPAVENIPEPILNVLKLECDRIFGVMETMNLIDFDIDGI